MFYYISDTTLEQGSAKGRVLGDALPSAGVWGTLSGGQCEGAPSFSSPSLATCGEERYVILL